MPLYHARGTLLITRQQQPWHFWSLLLSSHEALGCQGTP